jgi:hypothetical protein
MFSGLQQRWTVLLVWAVVGFVGRSLDAAVPPAFASTQAVTSVPPNTASVSTPFLTDPSQTEQSLDDIAAPATQPSTTNPPTAPQVINDPLPPAFWPGICMLALAGLLLSLRRLHRLLR